MVQAGLVDELGGDYGLELADLAGEEGVPDAEPACCLLAAPSRLDNRCTVGSGGSGRPWIRGQSFKLTGCTR